MSHIRDQRRAAILMAARQEFCEKGLSAASMSEIARRAGIGKSTIYEYFTSKDQLLEEACGQIWDAILQEMEWRAEDHNDFRERLLRYYRTVEEILKALGGSLVLLLGRDPLSRTLQGYVDDFQSHLLQRMEQVVEEGITAGELRQEIDRKAAAALLTTLPNPMLMRAMERSGVEDPLVSALDLVLEGIKERNP